MIECAIHWKYIFDGTSCWMWVECKQTYKGLAQMLHKEHNGFKVRLPVNTLSQVFGWIAHYFRLVFSCCLNNGEMDFGKKTVTQADTIRAKIACIVCYKFSFGCWTSISINFIKNYLEYNVEIDCMNTFTEIFLKEINRKPSTQPWGESAAVQLLPEIQSKNQGFLLTG